MRTRGLVMLGLSVAVLFGASAGADERPEPRGSRGPLAMARQVQYYRLKLKETDAQIETLRKEREELAARLKQSEEELRKAQEH